MGTDDRRCAYDNERPRHRVALAPYWIDRTPVTNEEYLAFMEDGGYRRPELWSDAGRAWLAESKADAPKYWWRESGAWQRRSMDRIGVPEPSAQVIHVCYHEAEAFARWAGKRLPTEPEWEIAAAWDVKTGQARYYPWGAGFRDWTAANLDQLAFDVAPVDTYPANVSPFVAYLATENCPATGKVFFVQGGQVRLFQPWTMTETIEKDGRWSVAELETEMKKLLG